MAFAIGDEHTDDPLGTSSSAEGGRSDDACSASLALRTDQLLPLRFDTHSPGRGYYDRKIAEGKTKRGAPRP